MPDKRLFRFSYLQPHTPGFAPIHELRDGDAFTEIAAELLKENYTYQGVLLNYPGVELTFQTAGIRPSDMVVMTTRPAIDDDPTTERFAIRRTNTELEKKILDEAMTPFLAKCSRQRIIVADEFAVKMSQRNRSDIVFTRHGRACYSELRTVVPGKLRRPRTFYEGADKTAAYLIRTRFAPSGPELLVAFSIDGSETLTWCHLLRTRYPHLLTSSRFVMAEITFPVFPETPIDLSFTKDFEVEILLDELL
jgi:hypothetical protein